jgi:predicted HicB family RNase H-like nuclease
MILQGLNKMNQQIKTFNIRIPKDTWLFLKKAAIAQETSMNEIIIRCVEKYRKKIEKGLTDGDAMV